MAGEKRRVLVVDDDQVLLDLVSALLRRINLEPIEAMTGADAAQIMRTPPLPHLLILDLMLPDISGIEFLRQMRGRAAFDAIPVIVLSALIDPELIREALNAGADRYITKPYIANNLISVVQDVLRQGRRVQM